MPTLIALLPKLRDWRNELVAWLGIVATIAAQVAAALDGWDLTSIDAALATLPAVVGIAARNVAYGREHGRHLEATVAELRARLAPNVAELDAAEWDAALDDAEGRA